MGGGTFQMLDLLPVGFRFQPTDKELVYLKHKLHGDDSDSLVANIPVLDLCKVEPWNIPAFSVIKSDEAEWYFFSPLHSNRVTRHGFWKYVGSDRNIKTTRTNIVIGTRKTLVFCRGRVETDWVIHEYHAAATIDDAQVLSYFIIFLCPEFAVFSNEL
ncbi:NAC domain-containing protein 62-like [Lotus japonicus]|uniref:NAC domain-containing protein 62-like n=1 Tax=Lotus japonicus TaxID=34305 RepID=UPI0025843789|nr:NAC domain-containing protein 62-like [Lotus japonicus]